MRADDALYCDMNGIGESESTSDRASIYVYY